MAFELCYLPDMPAVLRALAGAENSIERWWQQLEAAKKHSEGAGCEVIEERWANWLRQDPIVAIETQADNLRRLKALHIDCGEKDQCGGSRFLDSAIS